MVYSMRNNQGSDEPPKRHPPIYNPPTKALNDFFTTSTTKIFQILGLDDSFLDRDPQQWESEPSYSEAKNIISALKVTNDLAEKEWLSCSPSRKPWSEMRKKNSLFCKWWSTIETSSQKH